MGGGYKAMSKSIDERVVEMRFDNKQFESNVQTSMSTLDKLKKSLNLSGAAKGLQDIDNSAKNVNFSPLAKGVETVRDRFSALDIMGITTLANITNLAVNAGKKIMSALIIDPIKSGFQEYETQINAVQTILANTSSKGTSLDQVNSALDQLNTYADKTIYNFTEMTRNIGTFTAAGIDLNTSVSAIKGIANLAAVSGSTSQQASTAMYQLSQALASGTVKLMDWNSVVNAGMGGQVFQDSLKETARLHGVAIDQMITDEGSFRETLQNGWLTSDILTETLAKFTGDLNENQLRTMGYTEEQIASIIKMGQTANDAATKVKTFTQLFDTLKEAAQSGWTNSWGIIVGDFGEAKETLTKMSNTFGEIIQKSADSRNALLLGGLASGWKQLCEQGVSDTAGFQEAITNVAKSHGVDINSMINDDVDFQDALAQLLKDGKMTSSDLGTAISELTDKTNSMSEEQMKNAGYTAEQVDALNKLNEKVKDGSLNLEEFAQKMQKPSGRENLIEALWNSLDALLSVINPVKEAFREIFPAMTGEQLYAITEKIRDFTASLTLGGKQSDNLKRTFKGLFAVLDIIKQGFTAAIQAIFPFAKGAGTLGDSILSVTAKIGDWLVALDNAVKKSGIFKTVFGALSSVVSTTFSIVGKAFTFISNGINKVFDGSPLLERIQEQIANIGTTAGDMKDGVSKAFDSLGKAISNSPFANGLKNMYALVKSIAGDIVSSLSDMAKNAMDKLGDVDFSSFFDFLNTLSVGGIAIAITKFVKAVKDPLESLGGIKDIIKGVTNILDSVRGCFEAYQTKLKADALIKIATAIAILTGSLLVLSLIDSAKLASALAAMGGAFGELLTAMAIFNKIGGNIKGSVQTVNLMIGMSVAILILAGAMKTLSELDWNGIAKGLVGIAGLAAIMTTTTTKVLSKDGQTMMKGALNMVVFAAAMKILVSAVKDLSELSWEQIGKGLAGVGGLMAELSIFLNTAKFSGKALSTATGVLILSAAMKVLASVCSDFGSMDWGQIGKGLTSIGVLLTELALFTNLTGNASHVISTGIALVAIAGAMKILASAVLDFSTMSWEEIAKGLVAMGGALAELALGLIFMNGTLAGSGALLIAAAAIAVLTPSLVVLGSLSLESIGKALLVLAGSFVVLGVAGLVLAPLTPVIIALAVAFGIIGVAVLAIGAGLLAAGMGLTAIAAGIGALAIIGSAGMVAFIEAISVGLDGLIELMPKIAVLIVEIVAAAVTALVECLPILISGIGQLILGILDALATYGPQICDTLVTFLITIINTMASRIGEIVDAVMNFLINMLTAVSGRIGELVEPAVGILTNVILAVVNAAQPVIDIVLSVVQQFANVIVQILTALASTIETIGDSISQVFASFADVISTAGDSISEVLQSIADVIETAFNGISDTITAVGDSIRNVLDGIADIISSIGEAALNAGTGFENMANGVRTLTELNLVDMGASLATVAGGIATIAKNSEGLAAVGTGMEQISTSVQMSASSFSFIAAGIANMVIAMNSVTGSVALFNASMSSMSAVASMVMGSVVSVVVNAGTSISAASLSMMTGLASGISSGGIAAGTIMTALMTSLTTMVISRVASFCSAGLALASALANGLIGGSGAVRAALSSALSSCATSIQSYYGEFYSAGIYLGQGLTSGIGAQESAAYSAGYRLGQAAVNGEKAGQQSHSPSKATEKAGKWLGEGLIIGIKKIGSAVGKSGKDMGANAVNSISTALSNISALTNEDFSADPIITPVLDLSNIQNGVRNLDGLFSDTCTINLAIASGINFSSEKTSLMDTFNDAIKSVADMVASSNEEKDKKPIVIEVPVSLSGRQIAKASASYIKEETDKLDKQNSRKGGNL